MTTATVAPGRDIVTAATAATRPAQAALGTLFRPASRCGSACLSPAAATTTPPRRLVRLAATVAILVAAGVAAATIRVMPRGRRPGAAGALLRRTARALLRALGVRCTRTGPALPARRALVVANHISWLDILGLLATGDLRIVAKTDVAGWPVVGRLARISGTIFIDRERPRTLVNTVAEIREALAGGHVVAVFAEGTTTCGWHPVPYRPAAFQAAIDAGACVVPVVLRYRTGDGEPTSRPAFIGDETLIASLRRVLGMPSLHLDVLVHARLYPESGVSRGALGRLVTGTSA
ncbi:MAG TPA: lysophospholipid acyltransferase family protein [Micromonosporaceae bacterium]|nr:lysophospholipid acyltransferase family protein [Micromonosporaceae bacterium]